MGFVAVHPHDLHLMPSRRRDKGRLQPWCRSILLPANQLVEPTGLKERHSLHVEEDPVWKHPQKQHKKACCTSNTDSQSCELKFNSIIAYNSDSEMTLYETKQENESCQDLATEYMHLAFTPLILIAWISLQDSLSLMDWHTWINMPVPECHWI
jgi:hypothetical protein